MKTHHAALTLNPRLTHHRNPEPLLLLLLLLLLLVYCL
jgi:hypothetical protein